MHSKRPSYLVWTTTGEKGYHRFYLIKSRYRTSRCRTFVWRKITTAWEILHHTESWFSRCRDICLRTSIDFRRSKLVHSDDSNSFQTKSIPVRMYLTAYFARKPLQQFPEGLLRVISRYNKTKVSGLDRVDTVRMSLPKVAYGTDGSLPNNTRSNAIYARPSDNSSMYHHCSRFFLASKTEWLHSRAYGGNHLALLGLWIRLLSHVELKNQVIPKGPRKRVLHHFLTDSRLSLYLLSKFTDVYWGKLCLLTMCSINTYLSLKYEKHVQPFCCA